MPASDRNAQQLHGVDVSANIGEAMEARTKDALWFLVRQLCLGEWESKSGGSPVEMSVSWREHALKSAARGNALVALDLNDPLEATLEAETGAGDAPAWRAAALEYGFSVRTDRHKLIAEEYHGRGLDWHHFDYDGNAQPEDPVPAPQHKRVVPTQLSVRGAPHVRWWRFEDTEAYFDTPEDPEPNVLSTLLPELFFVDVNNWYVAPLPSRSGTLREILNVTMVDAFGIASTIEPIVGSGKQEEWRIFALSGGGDAGGLDGRYLLMPNIALEILENDDVEDVRFVRDDESFRVWAYEHRYLGADGVPVVAGDRARAVRGQPQAPAANAAQLPPFQFRSETEPEWIPYVPRYIHPNAAVQGGEMYLRRARSREDASLANPQYHGRIVRESWRVNEEEVAPTGIRIRRVMRHATGSDGSDHHWIGREREIGRRLTHPHLRFDYVDEPKKG